MRIEPSPGNPLPQRWRQGEVVATRLYLFGFLSLGEHTIRIERVDPHARRICSKESGRMARNWRHDITVADAGDGRALYSDEIEIASGLLTLPVWVFAWFFYRHRHRRWKKLLREVASIPTRRCGAAAAR
jgi:hypothetical protein